MLAGGLALAWAPSAWAQGTEAAWPSFRGDPQNRGVARQARWRPGAARPDSPATAPAWRSHGLVWGTCVVDGAGRSFVGSADRSVMALSPSGALLWRHSLLQRPDAVVDSAAALHPSGLVVFPGGDGALHAFDRVSGALRWRFEAQGSSEALHAQGSLVPSFEGNVALGPQGWLFAGSDDGHMYAVDPEGRLRWRFRTGMMIWSSPCFSEDGRWMAFGSLDGHLYWLDPATGRLLAQVDTGAEVKASPATDGQARVVVGNANGRLMAWDWRPGQGAPKLAWERGLRSEIYASVAWGEAGLVAATMGGQVLGLRPSDGATRWRFDAHAPIAASPVVSGDGVVVVGSKAGRFYALDGGDGRLLGLASWRSQGVGANLDASPAVGPDGRIWQGSYDGGIWHAQAPSLSAPLPPELQVQEDAPELGPVGQSGVHWRWADAGGAWRAGPVAAWPRHQALRLRLVHWNEGRLGEDLALQGQVAVEAKPPLALRATPSSDGRGLWVEPEAGLWPAGQRFDLRLKAQLRPKAQGFLGRWVPRFQAPWEAGLALAIAPADAGSGPVPPEGWGAAGMLLHSPEALDTYTPAALAGQAYQLLPAGLAGQGLQGLLAMPMQAQDAGVIPLDAPDRAFAMKARLEGQALVGEGRFRLAAMGGTIPFQRVRMSAQVGPAGLTQGQFVATADLLGVQANGQSFGFPLGLLDEVADDRLRLQAFGQFRGAPLLGLPAAAPEVKGVWAGDRLRLSWAPQAGKHLVAWWSEGPTGLGAWGLASVEGPSGGQEVVARAWPERALSVGGRLRQVWWDGRPCLGPSGP